MSSEVRIHRLAKYRKLDPLHWDFSPNGRLRLRRWDGVGIPNAVVVEDLPSGCVVVVDIGEGGLAEVRTK